MLKKKDKKLVLAIKISKLIVAADIKLALVINNF